MFRSPIKIELHLAIDKFPFPVFGQAVPIPPCDKLTKGNFVLDFHNVQSRYMPVVRVFIMMRSICLCADATFNAYRMHTVKAVLIVHISIQNRDRLGRQLVS